MSITLNIMTYKNTFDEAKEYEIEPMERNHLASLERSRGWNTLKGIIENYILKLTYNLAAGIETEKGSSVQELERLRGFVYFWNKIIKLVESDLIDNKDK